MKKGILYVSLLVLFLAGLGIGDQLARSRTRTEMARLESEKTILNTEIDRYRDVIRAIRSTADEAEPLVKDQGQGA